MGDISNSIKTSERFLAKVAARHAADPSWHTSGIAAAIADLHRYAFVWPDHTYLDGVVDAVEVMRQQGHQLLKWRNLWADPAFAGISSLWLLTPEDDHPLEIEFHTHAGWQLRDGPGYDLYQQYTDRRACPEHRDEIEHQLRQLRTTIATPDHAEWLTFEPSSPVHTTPAFAASDGYRYFAAVDGHQYSRQSPFAVIRRRIGPGGGRHDQAHTRGYDWRTEFFLIEAEHGDCQFDFHPIDRTEAERLVATLRARRLGPHDSDGQAAHGTRPDTTDTIKPGPRKTSPGSRRPSRNRNERPPQ